MVHWQSSSALYAAGVVVLLLDLSAPCRAEPVRDPIDYVFVAGRASGEIAMIDSRDDRVVGRVDLGLVPDQFVLSEAHRQLVATHLDEQTVSLFDLATMKPSGSIALGFRPNQIQLDDQAGVVAVVGSDEGKLALIALATRRIRSTVEGFAHPSDLIFDRTGERLFVASGSSSHIDVVDVGHGIVAQRIELEANGQGVTDLARTPGGKIGLALHGESGLISGLDLVAAKQVASTQVPGPADRAFPSANSQLFLVPNARDRSISVISSWTFGDVERLPASGVVSGISFGMFDTVAFAVDGGTKRTIALSLIDEEPRMLAVDLPGQPETGLSVEAGTKLYVALSDRDQLAVIDMRQPRLARLIDRVVNQPWAVNSAGGLSYCH